MTTSAKTLLAIYDMDKTVTRRATYNGFLLHMALNKSPWRLFLSPLLPVGLALYALKVWDRGRLKQFAQMLLIGHRVPPEKFARYLESHADLVVGKNVYPQLRERVAEEKAAGYRHVMATASYRIYVEAIAHRLGFDDVIGHQPCHQQQRPCARADRRA
jgi:phosphoserine phosphatase